MLNNIVDNIEQRGQHNIVQCCFHQPGTGCAFFAISLSTNDSSGQWWTLSPSLRSGSLATELIRNAELFMEVFYP